jgi:hypothetical protein
MVYSLLDQLIRPQQQQLRDRKAEHVSRLQVMASTTMLVVGGEGRHATQTQRLGGKPARIVLIAPNLARVSKPRHWTLVQRSSGLTDIHAIALIRLCDGPRDKRGCR